MESETIRSVIAAYFAAVRAMKVDDWLATFARDAEVHDPVEAPAMKGPEALRRFFLGITGAFQKIEVFEDHVFVSGTRAAVKWTGRGTGKNGRRVAFEGVDIFEIDAQGKILRMWGYWNPQALMTQLAA
jgi:steroid delta-isomerase